MQAWAGFGETLVERADEHTVKNVELGEAAGEAEEAEEGVEIFEGVDDRGAGEAPAGFSGEVGCGDGGFGFGIADLVRFVEDYATPVHRVQPTTSQKRGPVGELWGMYPLVVVPGPLALNSLLKVPASDNQ